MPKKLADMQLPKGASEYGFPEEAVTSSEKKKEKNEPKFPHGLRIELNRREIDKIHGLNDVKPGDMVNIIGMAKVINVRTNDKPNDKGTKEMTLQLQKLDAALDGDAEFSRAFDEATKINKTKK